MPTAAEINRVHYMLFQGLLGQDYQDDKGLMRNFARLRYSPKGILLKKIDSKESIEFKINQKWYKLTKSNNADPRAAGDLPHNYLLEEKSQTLLKGKYQTKWRAVEVSDSLGANRITGNIEVAIVKAQLHQYKAPERLRDKGNTAKKVFEALEERFKINDGVGIECYREGKLLRYEIADKDSNVVYGVETTDSYKTYHFTIGISGDRNHKALTGATVSRPLLTDDTSLLSKFINAINATDSKIHQFCDEGAKVMVEGVRIEDARQIEPSIANLIEDKGAAKQKRDQLQQQKLQKQQQVTKLVFKKLIEDIDKYICFEGDNNAQYIKFTIPDGTALCIKFDRAGDPDTSYDDAMPDKFSLEVWDSDAENWIQASEVKEFYDSQGLDGDNDDIARAIIRDKVAPDKRKPDKRKDLPSHTSSQEEIFLSLEEIFKHNNTVGVGREEYLDGTIKYTINGDQKNYTLSRKDDGLGGYSYQYLINDVQVSGEIFPVEEFVDAIRATSAKMHQFCKDDEKIKIVVDPKQQAYKTIFHNLLSADPKKLIELINLAENSKAIFFRVPSTTVNGQKDQYAVIKMEDGSYEMQRLYDGASHDLSQTERDAVIADSGDSLFQSIDNDENVVTNIQHTATDQEIFQALTWLMNRNETLGIEKDQDDDGLTILTISGGNGDKYAISKGFDIKYKINDHVVTANFPRDQFIDAINQAIKRSDEFCDAGRGVVLKPPVLNEETLEARRQEVNKLLFNKLLESNKKIALSKESKDGKKKQFIDFEVSDPSLLENTTFSVVFDTNNGLSDRISASPSSFSLQIWDQATKEWKPFDKDRSSGFYGNILLRDSDGIAQDIIDTKVATDIRVLHNLKEIRDDATDARIFLCLKGIYDRNKTAGIYRDQDSVANVERYTIVDNDDREYSISYDKNSSQYSYSINDEVCSADDVAKYFPKKDFIGAIREAAQNLRKFYPEGDGVAVNEGDPTDATQRRYKRIFEGLREQYPPKNRLSEPTHVMLPKVVYPKKWISMTEADGNQAIEFSAAGNSPRYRITRKADRSYSLINIDSGADVPINTDTDIDAFINSIEDQRVALRPLQGVVREVDIFWTLRDLSYRNKTLGIEMGVANADDIRNGNSEFTIKDSDGNSYKMTFRGFKIVNREIIGAGGAFPQERFIFAINDALANSDRFYNKFDERITVNTGVSKAVEETKTKTELVINKEIRGALLKTVESGEDIGLQIIIADNGDEYIGFHVNASDASIGTSNSNFVLHNGTLLVRKDDNKLYPLSQKDSDFFYKKDQDPSVIVQAIKKSKASSFAKDRGDPFRILRADKAADCNIEALYKSLSDKYLLNNTAVIFASPNASEQILGVTMANSVQYGIRKSEVGPSKYKYEYVSCKNGVSEVCKDGHFPVRKFIDEINARAKDLNLTTPEAQRVAKVTTPTTALKPTFTTTLHNYKFRDYKASEVKRQAAITIQEFIDKGAFPDDSPRAPIIEEYKKSLCNQNEEPRPKKAYQGIGANVELVKEPNGDYSLKINKIFDESDRRFKHGAGYVDGTGMKDRKIKEYYSSTAGKWEKIPSEPKDVAKIFRGEEGIKFRLDNDMEYECESNDKKVFVTSDCTKKVKKTVGGEVFDATKHGIEVLEKSSVAKISAMQKEIMPTEQEKKNFSKAPLGLLR